MRWEYDYMGTWAAESSKCDDGVPLVWVIGVCDDGTFDVSESDDDLNGRRETFPTLAAAKAFCESSENCMKVTG